MSMSVMGSSCGKLFLMLIAFGLTSCTSDIVRNEADGRVVRILWDYDRYFEHYYSNAGEKITPDRATAGAFFPSVRYYLIIQSGDSVDPLVKMVTNEMSDTLKSTSVKTSARIISVKIRMEHGDLDSKESRPIMLNLPDGDCVLSLSYHLAKDGRGNWRAKESVGVVE